MKEFDKIIGYESIKKELKRICDIIVNPEKYKAFGIKISQGLLLYGEPGVGKSLMADCFIKATKRKCFTCRKTKSNGDFVNEITKIFEKAKENAPSIIFFDDIDKFSNEDERHSDTEEFVAVQSGIDSIKNKDVFVIATANNIYKLPPSLRRNGRFSRIIEVNVPEGKDAEDIIRHYLNKKRNVGEVNYTEITRLLSSKTCADLETIVNEAGVYAAYEGKKKIEHGDLIKACLRVFYNAPEAEDILRSNSERMRKLIAYHEAGHTVAAEVLEPESITLVSMAGYVGDANGVTSIYQTNEYFSSINNMKNRVRVLLGGKAATEIVVGEIDVGAMSDLDRAFRVASRFDDEYCGFGFDSNLCYNMNASDMQRERHSQRLAYELDNAYLEVKEILFKNREFLEKIANALLEKTTLMMSDIQEIKNTCKIVR